MKLIKQTELSMRDYMEFQADMLVNSGIGATLEDFDARLQTAQSYIQGDQKRKALIELANMRHLFYNIQNRKNPRSHAIIHIIKRVKKKIGNLSRKKKK